MNDIRYYEIHELEYDCPRMEPPSFSQGMIPSKTFIEQEPPFDTTFKYANPPVLANAPGYNRTALELSLRPTSPQNP